MTEPRTSRRVARVVLLVLILGLAAVALPTGPAMWEWAAYGEWKPIWTYQLFVASERTVIICQPNAPPDGLSLSPKPQVLRDAQPLDSWIVSYFKGKQKRLRWFPGKDLLIRQIGKEEFLSLFPNEAWWVNGHAESWRLGEKIRRERRQRSQPRVQGY